MSKIEGLRREINGEENTFLFILRCELRWDWSSFYRLTSLMYEVAEECESLDSVDKYIAQGYWFVDTWVKHWTGHDSFPRPDLEKYEEAISLLHDLCYFFFIGESPFEDETLKQLAVRNA